MRARQALLRRALQDRAKSARAKRLLNVLLADVTIEATIDGSLPATEHNVTLDFLGIRFLQHVVQSDTFREKVRVALQQFDEQMKSEVAS